MPALITLLLMFGTQLVSGPPRTGKGVALVIMWLVSNLDCAPPDKGCINLVTACIPTTRKSALRSSLTRAIIAIG